jgi:hypothetical protein
MIVKRGKYYHYQFQINGKRYRGSTKSTNEAAALRIEAERRTACLRNPEQYGEGAQKLEFDGAFERFLSLGGCPYQTENSPAISSFSQTAHCPFWRRGDPTHEHSTGGSVQNGSGRRMQCHRRQS